MFVARFSARRYSIAVTSGLFLFLSGCSNFSRSLSERVDAPEVENIVTYADVFTRYSGSKIVTVSDYVVTGFSYVDHHCQRFFTEIELSTMNGKFAKDATGLAQTAATSILTATTGEGGKRAIQVLTALAGFASGAIESYNNIYHFAPYSGLIWGQVTDAMKQYRDSSAVTEALKSSAVLKNSVGAHAFAHLVVQNYARICTVPQIQVFIQLSLAKGKPVPSSCAGKSDEEKKADKACQGDSGAGGGAKPPTKPVAAAEVRRNPASASQPQGPVKPLSFPTFTIQ